MYEAGFGSIALARTKHIHICLYIYNLHKAMSVAIVATLAWRAGDVARISLSYAMDYARYRDVGITMSSAFSEPVAKLNWYLRGGYLSAGRSLQNLGRVTHKFSIEGVNDSRYGAGGPWIFCRLPTSADNFCAALNPIRERTLRHNLP